MLFAHIKAVLVVWGLGCLMWGCQTVKNDTKNTYLPSKEQLAYRARMFNEFLRWRAYDRAKYLVATPLRSAFEMRWEREKDLVHIIGFDVRDVTLEKGGKEALIVVIHDRYLATASSLQKRIFQQRWVVEQGDWFFKEDAVEKPSSAPAKPKPPPSSYMIPRTIP